MTVVSLLLWYRRRHRKSNVRPRDVLQAEFAPENDDGGGAADSLTHLTPFLNSTITRYPEAVPSHAPPSLPSVGLSLAVFRDNPPLYPASNPTESGPSPAPRFVVNNGDGTSELGSRNLSDAVEEKRRLAVSMGSRQDFGPGGGVRVVSGNGDSGMPPGYQLATQPPTLRKR